MADPSTILEFAEKISDITGRGMEYKSTRELLESTNKDLGPLLEQIRQYTEENDLPTDEIEKLRKVIEANQEVLDKCKIRGWNFWLAPYFQRKLDEEYQAIHRYCSVQMQTQIARVHNFKVMKRSMTCKTDCLSSGQTWCCWFWMMFPTSKKIP